MYLADDVRHSVAGLPHATAALVEPQRDHHVRLLLVAGVLVRILRQLLGDDERRQGQLALAQVVAHLLEDLKDLGQPGVPRLVVQQLVQDLTVGDENVMFFFFFFHTCYDKCRYSRGSSRSSMQVAFENNKRDFCVALIHYKTDILDPQAF